MITCSPRCGSSASEALGVPVELQNYALHFSGISPTVDLYGLVVHGAAPFSDPPLLQVEHARIGVRVVSLLRKKWYLSEFTISHAVVQIRVDANGNNNLPKPRQGSSSNGVQPLFDLAIRHAVLDRGEVYYNDRKGELDADLHDLTLNSAYVQARNVYSGQVAYSDGHLKSDGYEPIPHALSAEFEMTPTHLDLRQAELRSGASTIDFTATVDDFSNPRLAVVYHAQVDATELRRVLRNPQLPLGMLQLDGNAAYAAKPNQPALNGTSLEGTLRSERLEFREQGVSSRGIPSKTVRTEARAIRASYALANGNAELRSLTASLLGGTLEARATVRNLAGEQVGAAQVKLEESFSGCVEATRRRERGKRPCKRSHAGRDAAGDRRSVMEGVAAQLAGNRRCDDQCGGGLDALGATQFRLRASFTPASATAISSLRSRTAICAPSRPR